MNTFEKGSEINQTGQWSYTWDHKPNRIMDNIIVSEVKMEPSLEDDQSVIKVLDQTSNERGEAEGVVIRRMARSQNRNKGSGFHNPQRAGLAKTSYCEGTSSAEETDSGDEYLPPQKKRTQVTKNKTKTVAAKKRSKGKLPGLEKPSNSVSVNALETHKSADNFKHIIKDKPVKGNIKTEVPVVKSEIDGTLCSDNVNLNYNEVPKELIIKSKTKVVKKKSVETTNHETNETSSKSSDFVYSKLIKDEPDGGNCTQITLSKTKVVKKKPKMKEMTLQEVCEIFRSKYPPPHLKSKEKHFYNNFYPNLLFACKKYLIYRCRICTIDFDEVELAKEHFDKEHSKKTENFVDHFKKVYRCDQCGMAQLHLRNFVKHVDTLHNNYGGNQRLYSCDNCSFTTLDKFRFTWHVENHVKPRSNKTECHLCHLSFVNIKEHLKSKHGSKKGSKIKCPQCPRTFDCVRYAKLHQNYVHVVKLNLICKECGKVCKNGNLLKSHVRIHIQEPPLFECQICQSKLKFKLSFGIHMSRHLGGDKHVPFACADCGQRFSNNKTLLSHIRREHDKTCDGPDKNHLCETCGKSFELKFMLDRHVVVHTKEKKFVCSTCNKGFTQLDSLKTHQVVHTGIKPFECGKCGQKYSQKYPLTQHIKKHHPE